MKEISENSQELKLSAFLITLNEEANIKKCLESLDFCDEIIVVDSGSTDNTLRIAESFGAKIFHREFTGYRDQKQFALEQCTNEWVLSLDADERITPELKDFITTEIFNNSEYDGYEVRRLHFFLGKFIKNAGLYPDYKLRLFKKSKGYFTGSDVHEIVRVDGKVKKLKLDILHYSWKSILHLIESQLKYAERVAKNRYEDGKRAGILDFILKPAFTFFLRYFFRLGFLDGHRGFIISLSFAFFTAYKHFRIWELSRFDKNKTNNLKILKRILLPVQFFYGIFMKFREYLYLNNIFSSCKLNSLVISIGNLSMGGCGKTPLVIYLINELKKRNPEKKVCVILRGYKAKNKLDLPVLVNETCTSNDVGDEAVMLYHKLSSLNNVSVVACPDRKAAGERAIKELGAEILILDDAFQHLKIQRDLNICLIDSSDEDSMELFPIGSLRENFSALKRADKIILSRTDVNPRLRGKIQKIILENCHSKEPEFITELKEEITDFFNPSTGKSIKNAEIIKSKKILAFCGIGNPMQFLCLLKKELFLCDFREFIVFSDHYDYKFNDIKELKKRAELNEADFLITTEKDYVKLKDSVRNFSNILVARLNVSLNEDTINNIDQLCKK